MHFSSIHPFFPLLLIYLVGILAAEKPQYDGSIPTQMLENGIFSAGLQDIQARQGNAAGKPNILFIMSDDQDKLMDSMDYMPNVKSLLADKGVTFNRHYCTNALCCPSRASILTGKCVHNINVTDVHKPLGGYDKFIAEHLNQEQFPVWLQDGGINTYYVGKLLNGMTDENLRNPFPAGWTGSNFLIQPGVYDYLHTIWSKNGGKLEPEPGKHAINVITNRALNTINEAVQANKPFFLGVAPAVPHLGLNATGKGSFPPIPQDKWKGAFADAKVPRNPNWNPDKPSLVSWIHDLPQQEQPEWKDHDEYYRARLRVIAGLDDMVKDLIDRLKQHNILDNTYIFYTTDNGYHISQHRLGPGKKCGIEEDVNIPMILRGPNVPKGLKTDLVTTHTDLAPTFLNMFNLPPHQGLDGKSMPYSSTALDEKRPFEHVNIEFWGEGSYGEHAGKVPGVDVKGKQKHSYKAIRIFGSGYNLFYSVWCNGDHELYDMAANPYQMNNLLASSTATSDGTGTSLDDPSTDSTTVTGIDAPLSKLRPRLNALVLVLKQCQGPSCRDPWGYLHPKGDVKTLQDALADRFDAFYQKQPKVRFEECLMAYETENEMPLMAGRFEG